MPIAGIAETRLLVPVEATLERERTASPTTQSPQEVSFGSIIAKTLEEANQTDHAASAKVDALARGASDDIHGTMISIKEAEISMKLVGSIRNKLLDAFHEIWRTSV
jgi:flagellar hook-basal body complex protein FliE